MAAKPSRSIKAKVSFAALALFLSVAPFSMSNTQPGPGNETLEISALNAKKKEQMAQLNATSALMAGDPARAEAYAVLLQDMRKLDSEIAALEKGPSTSGTTTPGTGSAGTGSEQCPDGSPAVLGVCYDTP